MPSKYKKVRFETEYNSSFKAFNPDVYKSPLIEALLPEPAGKELHEKNNEKAAGLQSNKFSRSIEPPLQHKRLSETASYKSPTTKYSDDNLGKTTDKTKEKNRVNRALEFKVGLRPETSMGPKKPQLSEYKRQYDWKKNAQDASPLLNAEKIVFDSHTNIPRFVHDRISHETEYQSKFNMSDKKRKKDNKDRNKVDNEQEKVEELPSSAVKRLLQTSQNPDVPFFPHGSSRVYHSEYQANFGSPKKYKYKEGIWLGAKPPHLLPDDESTPGSNGASVTNWFEEVLELREKAKQYKIRALEGNYFSREFLAKLDAELEAIFREESSDAGTHSEKVVEQPSNGTISPPKMKYAWKDNDVISSDLKKPALDNSLDLESLSSGIQSTENDSTSSSQEGKVDGRFAKTYTKKVVPEYRQKTILKRTTKRSSAKGYSSGSEASSERSEDEEQSSKTSSKHYKENNCGNDLDRFNIDSVKRLQSNDAEILSSSIESIYGSNSDRKNDFDSVSVSSLASNEALARHTLSRAKQRNEKFWNRKFQ